MSLDMAPASAAAPKLNEPAARGLDEITRSALATAYAAVGLTFQSESWRQLGFASFEDWAIEQPSFRMNRLERRAKALEYTVTLGMTQREAAAALGVSPMTVNADLHVRNRTDEAEPTHAEEPAVYEIVQGEPNEAETSIAESDSTLWRSLISVMEAIETVAMTKAPEIAANVPSRRRAATARRLRKLGTYLGGIAWSLEGKEPSRHDNANSDN